MTTHRRGLVAAVPLVAAGGTSRAQSPAWPDRPLRIIVPFPPGGPVDGGARVVAQVLTEGLGQPVVIENRSGAGGSIGTEAAKAAPDGNTLHFGSTGSLAVNQSLIPNLSYDTRRDFAAVSVVSAVPMLMVARTGLAARDVRGVIAPARARPNALTYATSGPGGAPHLVGEMMRQKAGVHLTMVAYRGAAPAMTALLAQEVDVTFLDPAVLMPHVREGRMRALAVTGPQRLAALPDYPTLLEAGLDGVEVENWYALLAPAGTPPERIARVHAALSAALARPETLRGYVEQGQRVLNLGPQQSASFIRTEVEKWAEVVRSAGMKPE